MDRKKLIVQQLMFPENIQNIFYQDRISFRNKLAKHFSSQCFNDQKSFNLLLEKIKQEQTNKSQQQINAFQQIHQKLKYQLNELSYYQKKIKFPDLYYKNYKNPIIQKQQQFQKLLQSIKQQPISFQTNKNSLFKTLELKAENLWEKNKQIKKQIDLIEIPNTFEDKIIYQSVVGNWKDVRINQNISSCFRQLFRPKEKKINDYQQIFFSVKHEDAPSLKNLNFNNWFRFLCEKVPNQTFYQTLKQKKQVTILENNIKEQIKRNQQLKIVKKQEMKQYSAKQITADQKNIIYETGQLNPIQIIIKEIFQIKDKLKKYNINDLLKIENKLFQLCKYIIQDQQQFKNIQSIQKILQKIFTKLQNFVDKKCYGFMKTKLLYYFFNQLKQLKSQRNKLSKVKSFRKKNYQSQQTVKKVPKLKSKNQKLSQQKWIGNFQINQSKDQNWIPFY